MLDVDVENLGNLFQVNILVDQYGICLYWQFCYHWADIVVAIVVHDVVGCNECWDISTSLFWKIWIDVPVISITLSAMDSLVDIGWTAVVCSNDKTPVVEYLVEVAQIVLEV